MPEITKEEAQRMLRQAGRLKSLGYHTEALRILDALQEQAPKNKDILFQRGESLAALGRTDEALEISTRLTVVFNDPRGKSLRLSLKPTEIPSGIGPVRPEEDLAPKAKARPVRRRISWFRIGLLASVVLGAIVAVLLAVLS